VHPYDRHSLRCKLRGPGFLEAGFGWILPGAPAIDIDFTRSLFYGTSLGALTTTRASTGYAESTSPSTAELITNGSFSDTSAWSLVQAGTSRRRSRAAFSLWLATERIRPQPSKPSPRLLGALHVRYFVWPVSVVSAGTAQGGGSFVNSFKVQVQARLSSSPRVVRRVGYVSDLALRRAPFDNVSVKEAAGWWSFASNLPRITNQGLLVEEARTNSIRNNSMQGAVAGTPGTLPTNWNSTGSPTNGISLAVVGTGTQNGIDYIDLRYSGTASAATTFIVNFETANAAAASSGQTWTQSVFAAIAAGSLTGIASSTVEVVGTNGTSGVENGSATMALTAALTRFFNTFTFANVGTTNARGRVIVNVNNGGVVDITLRIGWPQLELGAFATSPIRTTSAAATRAADVITGPTSGLSSTFSFYAEANVPQVNGSASWRVFELLDGSANSARVRCNGASSYVFENNVDGGVSLAAITAGATQKVAGAIALNDMQAAQAGVLGTADTVVTPLTTITQFNLGNSQLASPRQMNGYLRRLALFNSRLSNAQLQALST
jgi:hypothetical protein